MDRLLAKYPLVGRFAVIGTGGRATLPNRPALARHERARMETIYLPLQMAPTHLSQPILPNWSLHLFNVDMGASSNAAIA